jgi:hypothetical protein
MVFENVNMSSDKKGATANETDTSPYTLSAVYISTTCYFHMYIGLKCLISVRKLNDLPFILCYELNIQCNINPLISKGDG